MKNTTVYISLCLFLMNLFGWAEVVESATKADRRPLRVSRVALNTKTFNPLKDETVSLTFEINKQADVQVIIYDRLGQEAQRFYLPGLEAGKHSLKWDGRKADGKCAPGNVFLYVIEARKGREKITYNLAKETGGVFIKPLEFTFDKKTGKIEYVLPKTCMIRLRAGLKNSMLARTIFDWGPQTAGRHVYKWDGKDKSGTMNLLRHPELDLNLTCYTLPENTVIVTGQVAPFEPKKKAVKAKSGTESDPWPKKGKYFHYQHDPRNCHEPRFKVLFPEQKKTNPQGVPVVSGVTPLRVELDPRDGQYLVNKRFEIMIFIDGVYIFEVEEGSAPFTYKWDTRGLSKGPHLVSVNVMSYDDHVGVISRKVVLGDD